MQQISLGFSAHRPEMIPLIARAMRRHQAVYLEEPPTPGFERMLQKEMSVDDYLLPVDAEYPAFSRAVCRLLRELRAEGRVIRQVEPFVESLVWIHELFAGGRGPADLPQDSLHVYVHRAERAATGALLAFYRTVASGSFDEAIAAVDRFASADAARFRLRDSLRAQALAPRVQEHPSAYVECGQMHVLLWRRLRERLPAAVRVRPLFLTGDALRSFGASGRAWGPGDLLTLHYIFHPHAPQTDRTKLLAARAMVYAKILQKQEFEAEAGQFPHLLDELACIRAAGRLSLADCRRLFPLLRRTSTAEARRVVTGAAAS
jgi:hypothetical protein